MAGWCTRGGLVKGSVKATVGAGAFGITKKAKKAQNKGPNVSRFFPTPASPRKSAVWVWASTYRRRLQVSVFLPRWRVVA
ncbi:hypothetical protein GCM10023172_01160 [Hymenobacter ginsengisoli]|uniref:Uncharacterized protein n=1 Tax=Hymenobacter ginsengisoli TaxID=1051626 RepID=A0ABP8PXP1_9BACT